MALLYSNYYFHSKLFVENQDIIEQVGRRKRRRRRRRRRRKRKRKRKRRRRRRKKRKRRRRRKLMGGDR